MQPKRDINAQKHRARLVLQNLLSMIDHSSMAEIQQHALHEMVRLTGSRVGFFCLVDSATKTVCLKWVSGIKPQPVLPDMNLDSNTQRYYTECLASGQPVIQNRKTDLPALDADSVQRHLAVPVFEKGQPVAVIVVADRAADYCGNDAEVLEKLAHGLWRVVVRKRLHDSISDDVK